MCTLLLFGGTGVSPVSRPARPRIEDIKGIMDRPDACPTENYLHKARKLEWRKGKQSRLVNRHTAPLRAAVWHPEQAPAQPPTSWLFIPKDLSPNPPFPPVGNPVEKVGKRARQLWGALSADMGDCPIIGRLPVLVTHSTAQSAAHPKLTTCCQHYLQSRKPISSSDLYTELCTCTHSASALTTTTINYFIIREEKKTPQRSPDNSEPPWQYWQIVVVRPITV